MPHSSIVRRVWGPTLLTAATSTGIAIVVNVATDAKSNLWAWVAVGSLTVLAFFGSLWSYRRQHTRDERAAETRIGRNVRIDAKDGSAAAWKMESVSLGATPPRARSPQPKPPQSDIEVKGNVDIDADKGSAAAWSMDNISINKSRSVDPRTPGD
jgi:hypothetical protein